MRRLRSGLIKCQRRSASTVVALICLATGLLPAGAAAADVADVAQFLRALEAADTRLSEIDRHALVSKSLRSPRASVVARARFEALLDATEAENSREAAAQRRALGLVQDAWLVGPFENTSGMAFEQPTAVELKPFDVDERVQARIGDATWQRVKALPDTGAFPVAAYLENDEGALAVLAFFLDVRRDSEVVLHLSASGQIAARVDDVEVFRADQVASLGFDTHAVKLQLSTGSHLVRLRIGNADGSFRVRARITDATGAATDRVRATLVPSRGPGTGPPVSASEFKNVAADALEKALDPFASAQDCLDAALVLNDAGAVDERHSPTRVERIVERAITAAARTPEDADVSKLAVAARIQLAQLVARRDATRARTLLDEARIQAPSDAAAAAALARLFEDEGREVDARRLWNEVRRAPNASNRDRLEALRFLRRGGRNRLATDLEIFALARETQGSDALLLAADIARERSDLALAETFLTPIRTRAPAHDALLSFDLDRLRATTGSAGDVIKILQRRLKHRPHFHRLAEDLALTLDAAGRAPEADALIAARTSTYPQCADSWRASATVARWRGRDDNAADALRLARELRPQDAQMRRMWRALQRGEDSVLRLDPVDLKALLAAPPLPGALAVGAEVIIDRVGARFFENGLGHIEREQVLRILNPEKAREWQTLSFSYAEGREELEVLVAEHTQADGTQLKPAEILDRATGGGDGVYSDERVAQVRFERFSVGDVVRVVVREDLIGRQNWFGDFFGLVEPISGTLPVRRWSAILDAPKSRPIFYAGRGVPTAVTREKGDRKIWTFTRAEVPRVEVEPGMPPFLAVGDYLSVSTYEKWDALGAWYANLINGQLDPSDELAAQAHVLVKGAKTTEEKVRILYEWVVTTTRYVGIELGIHGWKPYSVNEVVRRRFGDCKDKASLLVSLLTEVGIGAQIALVRTANLGVLDETPPTMWAFNHAITYVPALDLYLDGTAEHAGAGELPALDQGAMALLVTPHLSRALLRDRPIAELRRIPVPPASENRNTSAYHFRIDTSGHVILTGEEHFAGAGAAVRRARLADASRRSEVIGAELAQVVPGADVTRVYDVESALGDQTVGYKLEARLPRYGTPIPEGLRVPLTLYPHDLVATYASRSTRSQAIWIAAPWRTRNQVDLQLPADVAVWALPSSETIDTPHLKFTQTVTKTSKGVRIVEDTAILSRTIPAEDYDEFRAAALAAEALMKRTLTLEFGEGAS